MFHLQNTCISNISKSLEMRFWRNTLYSWCWLCDSFGIVGNNIGPKGAKALADGIVVNNTVHSINLDRMSLPFLETSLHDVQDAKMQLFCGVFFTRIFFLKRTCALLTPS